METKNGVVMRDPQELHEFANFINRERNNITNDVRALYMMMKAMNETWDDVQNEYFAEEFVKQIDNIQKLTELLTEYSSFVERKARQIDEYNRRFNFR